MSEQRYYNSFEIRAVLSRAVKKEGLRKFSRRNDHDPGHISKILSFEKPITPAVAGYLGFDAIEMYVKKVKGDEDE